MIHWELKKIFKSRTGIIVAAIFILLCGAMVFLKPEMEVQYRAAQFWRVYAYRATNTLMTFCMVIILIIVCSNIYTDEIVSTVEDLILTSKNKNKVLYSKLSLGILIPTVLYGVYLVIQFIITAVQYGMPINGKLQCIRIVDNPILIRDSYSIIQFIAIKIGIMLLILATLGVIACLCSFTTRSSIASTSGFLIFIIFAKVLTMVKIIPVNLRMVLETVNFLNLIFYFDQFACVYYGNIKFFGINFDLMNLCLGILVATMVAGITLSIVVFKKVLVR